MPKVPDSSALLQLIRQSSKGLASNILVIKYVCSSQIFLCNKSLRLLDFDMLHYKVHYFFEILN